MSLRNLKVLVCDDHVLIREGLKRVLLDTGRADLVGETATAEEAMAAIQREAWDIVILDINLGGRSGMDGLKEIRAKFPRLPVLILSAYPEDQFAVRAIRAGANGYLNKNLATKDLIEAIRRVLAEGQYISPQVTEQLLNAVKQSAGQPMHAALSDREDQVLRLIASGRTVGEIARHLALNAKTISTYRSIVLRKLCMENNAQLVRYAVQHGLSEW